MSTVEELRGVAEMLHRKTCRLDHNDQCAWGYETEKDVVYSKEFKSKVTVDVRDEDGKTVPGWDRYAHQRYYDRAKDIMDRLEPDVPAGVVIMVLEAL